MLFNKIFVFIKCSKDKEKKGETLKRITICTLKNTLSNEIPLKDEERKHVAFFQNASSSTYCFPLKNNLLDGISLKDSTFSVFPEEIEKIKFRVNISKLNLKYIHLPKLFLVPDEDFNNELIIDEQSLSGITNVNICLLRRLINMQLNIFLNKNYNKEILEIYEILIKTNINDPFFVLTLNNVNKRTFNIVKEVNNVLLTLMGEDNNLEWRLKLLMIKKIKTYINLKDVKSDVKGDFKRDEYVENSICEFKMHDLLKICEMLNEKLNEKLKKLKEIKEKLKVKTNQYFDMNSEFSEFKVFNTEDSNYIKEEHYLRTVYENLNNLIYRLKTKLEIQKIIANYIYSLGNRYIKMNDGLLKFEKITKKIIDKKINEINSN